MSRGLWQRCVMKLTCVLEIFHCLVLVIKKILISGCASVIRLKLNGDYSHLATVMEGRNGMDNPKIWKYYPCYIKAWKSLNITYWSLNNEMNAEEKKKQQSLNGDRPIDSEGFWQWCITLRITGVSDFIVWYWKERNILETGSCFLKVTVFCLL
jgi:hypothetical protein